MQRVWAAFVGKCFSVESWWGVLKKSFHQSLGPLIRAQDPSPSGIPYCHLTSILPTEFQPTPFLLGSVEVENSWLSCSLPGLLEIQGLSSGQVTLPVLLAVGSGLDQIIISPIGQREQR